MKTKIVRVTVTVIKGGEITLEVPESSTIEDIEAACHDDPIADAIEDELSEMIDMDTIETRYHVSPAMGEAFKHLSIEDTDYHEALSESGLMG